VFNVDEVVGDPWRALERRPVEPAPKKLRASEQRGAETPPAPAAGEKKTQTPTSDLVVAAPPLEEEGAQQPPPPPS